MKTKNTARKRNSQILSVTPITSREDIGVTRNATLLRALTQRYKTVLRYVEEAAQLRAAIRALGGKLNE